MQRRSSIWDLAHQTCRISTGRVHSFMNERERKGFGAVGICRPGRRFLMLDDVLASTTLDFESQSDRLRVSIHPGMFHSRVIFVNCSFPFFF